MKIWFFSIRHIVDNKNWEIVPAVVEEKEMFAEHISLDQEMLSIFHGRVDPSPTYLQRSGPDIPLFSTNKYCRI